MTFVKTKMERIDILLNNQVLEVDLNDLAGNEDPLIGIVSQDPSNHSLFLRFAVRRRILILD